MALPKEYSVLTGLATAGVVYGTYRASLPSAADARSMKPNQDLEKSERTASWISAGVVSGISLLTRDSTVFIMGGVMLITMAWLNRHANAVQPTLGKVGLQAVPRVSQETAPASFSAPKSVSYGAAI